LFFLYNRCVLKFIINLIKTFRLPELYSELTNIRVLNTVLQSITEHYLYMLCAFKTSVTYLYLKIIDKIHTF